MLEHADSFDSSGKKSSMSLRDANTLLKKEALRRSSLRRQADGDWLLYSLTLIVCIMSLSFEIMRRDEIVQFYQ